MGRYAQAARRGGTRFSPLVASSVPAPGAVTAAFSMYSVQDGCGCSVEAQEPLAIDGGFIQWETSESDQGPWSPGGSQASAGQYNFVWVDGAQAGNWARFRQYGGGSETLGAGPWSTAVYLVSE